MLHNVLMPRLSDSMEEGIVLKWLKTVGDEVAVGEMLAEIETDKATMAFEADVAGELLEIVCNEGDASPIGGVIARIGDADGRAELLAGAEGREDGMDSESLDEPSELPDSSGKSRRSPIASPVARRMARELAIDLATLVGTGRGGRITKADVETAAASEVNLNQAPMSTPSSKPTGLPATGAALETSKGAVESVEPTRLQKAIARRMAESKATAPHFYLQRAIDVSEIFDARQSLKDQSPDAEDIPSFNDMVVKAVAGGLRACPKVNGSYKDGHYEFYSRVNVGIAVASDGGLVVPIVFDADKKGLREIGAESRALAKRVREGSVTPPELSGGTFTVSNLGMYGVDSMTPVINLPQAAILGVGAIVETPIAKGGKIASGWTMHVTFAGDHRIINGADGAEFLAIVARLLESPLALAL